MRELGFDLEVKNAATSDINRLNAMRRSTVSGTVFGLSIPFEFNLIPNSITIVAKNKTTKRIIGFAVIQIESVGKKKVGEVSLFAVSKKYREKRVGRKIFGEINRYFIKNRVAFAYLYSSKRAKKFYSRTNWHKTRFPEFEWLYRQKVANTIPHFSWFPRAKKRLKTR